MSRSEALFNSVQKHIPGGVNSPVCAFKSVGSTPLFFKHAEDAYVLGEDNKHYADYVGSWGPVIFGHSRPDMLDAVRRQLDYGLSCGAPATLEVEMADLVCSMVPSIEMVRMVSSDTETTIGAIRLTRGYTGHDSIIKFEGCYHGHSDSLLVKTDSGTLTFGVPNSPGAPAAFVGHTLTLSFNGIEVVHKTLGEVGKEVAYIIIESVTGSMSCVPPTSGFLESLREACDKHGMVLISDEVMTGFRAAFGDAQAYYGVTPDLSTFGRIIGGSMPVGAFDGKREIMQQISPPGSVYRADTLSGNPLAMAAGLTTPYLISRPSFHDELTAYVTRMLDGLQQYADAAGIPFVTAQAGDMFGLYFSGANAIVTFKDMVASDTKGFRRFFHLVLDGGVHLAPNIFEVGFISIAHGDKELGITLNAAEKTFTALK